MEPKDLKCSVNLIRALGQFSTEIMQLAEEGNLSIEERLEFHELQLLIKDLLSRITGEA